MFGPVGATLMAVAILISTFGCNNGLILAGARVYYAMARDGCSSARAGKLNRTACPPPRSSCRRCGPALLCLTGTYGQLLDYVIFAALHILRADDDRAVHPARTRPDAERPYRAIGYPVLPALYIVLATA